MACKLLSNQTPAATHKTQPPVTIPKKVVDTLTDDERTHVEDYHKQFEGSLSRLVDIHTYCRPHNSGTIDLFVDKFLMYYDGAKVMRSSGGEPMAVMICTDSSSRTMFSAHVDTVHSYSGRQVVEYDEGTGLLMKPAMGKQYGDCLGADDGAGIWLLLEMIDAKVPGTYLFHYGEERGGVGSSLMAKERKEFLGLFDRAIAFDRKGTQDVITYQGFSRCCSDDFANALAAELNATGQHLSMKASDDGIFTDTANYTSHIAECTNIACGYEDAHSSSELLDVEYLMALRNALLVVDWENLPTVRDKNAVDDLYGSWDSWQTKYRKTPAKPLWFDVDKFADKMEAAQFGTVLDFVHTNEPEDVAEVIYELASRVAMLRDEVWDMKIDEAADGEVEAYDEDDDMDRDRLDVGLR